MALFFYKEKNKDIRAAAYLRLSIEDGDKAESNSIGNQRELIRDFAAERPGLYLVEEYALSLIHIFAICGRPVARRLDDGYTLEVNRLCTDGTPNACSILYAAAYRAARAMGYNKVITYILDTENGSSLKAAGYTCEGRAGGLEWNGAKAPKQADQYPRQMKTRWVKKKEGLHGS